MQVSWAGASRVGPAHGLPQAVRAAFRMFGKPPASRLFVPALLAAAQTLKCMLQDGHLWGVAPAGGLLCIALPRTRLPAGSIIPGLVPVVTVPLVAGMMLRQLALLRLGTTAHSMVAQCYYQICIGSIDIWQLVQRQLDVCCSCITGCACMQRWLEVWLRPELDRQGGGVWQAGRGWRCRQADGGNDG